jgi:autotransporter-associated beta strand protein
MKAPAKVLFLLCLIGCPVFSALPRTLAWVGDGHDGLWSNRTNWWITGTSYPNYALPADGDNIDLNSHNFTGTIHNDLTGLKVANITVNYDYVVNGNSLTVTNGITLYGDGSGTATFNLPLVFPNNQTVLADTTGGQFTENTAYLHFNGAITVTGGTVIFQANGSDPVMYNSRIYLAGAISGSGNIWVRDGVVYPAPANDCSIEFDGVDDNTFTGYLRISTLGGSQVIFHKSSGHAVNSHLEVLGGDNANLYLVTASQFGANTEMVIQDGSSLHLDGNDATVGSISMTDFNTDANPSVLDTGSDLLSVNAGISGASFGNVTPLIEGKLNLAFPMNISASGNIGPSLEIQAPIQGTAFEKTGGSTLILSASNTFSGILNVHEGILDVRNAGALSVTSGQTFLTGNGSLTLRNLTINGITLTSDGYQTVVPGSGGSLLFTIGTCNWNGPIVLDTNLVVWADDTTLNGQISGTGGLDFIYGVATIAGSSANTYTGPTIAECELLQLNKSSGATAYQGSLVVGNTGAGGPFEARWLQPYQRVQGNLTVYANGIVNLNNHNEDFGAVTFNGGEVDTGTGQFAIYQPLTVNASSSTATVNGYLGLPAGDSRYFNINDGAADPDLTVNAVMFGSPTYFVKEGAGNMRLANANTFNAVTLHEGGTLELANTAALSSAPCVILDGATLRLNAGGTFANNFEAVGSGVGGTSGAFQVVGANSASLNGSILLDANTLFSVAPGAALALNGALTGSSGALTKSGNGALTVGGSSANTYGGLTTINSGLFYPAKSGAVPGNLVLGPAPLPAPASAIFLSPNAIGGTNVTVNAYSTLNLNGRVQTLSRLNLNDGGSVATGGGALYLNGGSIVSCGSLNLLGSSAPSSITGNIGLPPNSFAVTFSVGSFNPTTITTAPELNIPATIYITSAENPNFLHTRVVKEGSGRLRFGGNNSYVGDTFVDAGILQVDGVASGGFNVSGGTLSGTGIVGPIAMTASTSIVSPGHSPGILTSSNFNSSAGSGIFKVELDGTNAGTGYSQLAVNGTINLNNINLQASLNFASSSNDTFTIIKNYGLNEVVGTFNGLPAGKTFYIGGQLFQISYGGGFFGINNVVLSRLATPVIPSLTIQSQPPDSVRLLWPTSSAPLTLQFITNLAASNWTTVSQTPVVIGTNNVVTNNATTLRQQFYRLRSP